MPFGNPMVTGISSLMQRGCVFATNCRAAIRGLLGEIFLIDDNFDFIVTDANERIIIS